MRHFITLLFALTLARCSLAAVSSTGDKDNDFALPANWGGVDPASRPDEIFTISPGHQFTFKETKKENVWPAKSIVVSKGAALTISTFYSCAGKSLVLDGGELVMDARGPKQLTIDVRADSIIRINTGSIDSGAIIGKGALELAREGGGNRTLALKDVDLSRYAGKFVIGEALKSRSSLALSGRSRDMQTIPIVINPPNRVDCWIKFENGVNMQGPLTNPSRWGKLHLGNTACTFGHGSILGPKADNLAPGIHTPATTANYTQIPKLKGGFSNLQETIEPSSIEGSSITILPPPEAKPINRIDTGSAFVLKEGDNDFSKKGEALILNGGVVEAKSKATLVGTIQMLNESTLSFGDALQFSRGSIAGSGTLHLAGKGGRIVFEIDFDLSAFDGKIIAENLQGPAELVFRNAGWGSATLVLNAKSSVTVSGNGALQTIGTLIFSSTAARLDLGKSQCVISVGSRLNEKEFTPGTYTTANTNGFKAVPATWTEKKNKEAILISNTVDLSPHLNNVENATLRVVDFKRVPSTAATGIITAPESWGGLSPNRLAAAQYEISVGHTLAPGSVPWRGRELAIARGGVLSLSADNLDLGGRSLFFHGGTLLHDAPATRTVSGDLVIFDDHQLKDEYVGTLLLNGGDLTVTGALVGARNRQSTLHIRRTKPGTSKLTIDGDMSSVAPTGLGFDVDVSDVAGHLDCVFSRGILNEAYITFAPKSGTFSSNKGINAPRATLKLPANPDVKLDLKNSVNTLLIGTTIGGVIVDRGVWTEANTDDFTRVPECNTTRRVDLTPFLLNTKNAALRISNPRAGLENAEVVDTNQLFAPDAPFNAEFLKQLRDRYTEEWVAPFRTALQTKRSYHDVVGKPFSHSDYTYGTFAHVMFNTHAAYKILNDDPAIFERMMVLADYMQQLLTLDPMATDSADARKVNLPCPAEAFTCACLASLTLCAHEIWKKESLHPGTVDKKLLEKADQYMTFAWHITDAKNPSMGLKKYLYFDGKTDVATGAPECVAKQGKFSWNSASGIWLPAAPLIEAIRYRKLATGKTDWDGVESAVVKSISFYNDFFFKDNSVGEIDSKKYVWWTYNTTTDGQPGFKGNGPGWQDGLYKGMKIIKGGEDYAHCQAELLGWHWIWYFRPNSCGLMPERMERIANGAFNALGNTPFGGLQNMFNPYRIELGDPIPPGGFPTASSNYALPAVFAVPKYYRFLVMNAAPRLNHLDNQMEWLWVKYLYLNCDKIGARSDNQVIPPTQKAKD